MKRVRRMFRGGKVWAEVGERGQLVANEDGITQIRYREDDERSYSVRAADVLEIDEAAIEEAKRARKERSARAKEERAVQAAPASDVLFVFTGGACFGSPGPAGIGVVLEWRGVRKEMSRSIGSATANRAELCAVREALQALKRDDLCVRVDTRSAFVVGVLQGDWSVGTHVDLVQETRALMARFSDLEICKGDESVRDDRRERAVQLARDGMEATDP